MERKTINRLIGYGILIFTVGYILGLTVSKYLQLLVVVGSLSTFVGIFYFFKPVKLRDEFRKDPNDDILTYFWNAIVLKFWTFIFFVWMIIMDIVLFTIGFLE
ncbi:hypothetical protein LVD15_03505 [Fulvivirga maritima]|uniref:hypothetical protein n=1 Tax=Fulvivirga maritima TaxID=2904247 RepID=UPI001F2F5186|nr:hypothetical protein [Fulvivirga maritima]UII27511.1 hypothetical protein LVD15_03505 [Fulvivirga maritima]